MQQVIQLTLSGIAIGSIYACLAVALVLIYKTTRHVNFAQGEMATFSAYVALFAVGLGLPLWLAAVGAVLFAFVSGMVIERVVIRRFHNASATTFVVACIALFIGINSLSGWIFGHDLKAFPSIFGAGSSSVVPFLSAHEVGSILTVVVIAGLLYMFLSHTSLGLAMRATADNPVSARLSGVPVDWLLTLGWGIAAAVGAVAALLVAPIVFLDPNMMIGVLIYAFAAALLGGLDSPWGAIVGGIVIGVIENLAGAYVVGNDMKLSLALLIIVAVLMLMPQGLLGRKTATRV
ncbi:branched-chain amino acid ABC transporter permease [Pararhodobacter zhoushanensis]|uniref:Branched-chain amino acid ABC transporter permease n=1 Tax=Pararhodobacter zhoushanensis TaxID=2479545 RepID=A0ABT3H145_9RHOB|nr:branched-chain amino acid ABC transporter permease [Pararhodobacter zhoushanensis]MCW1933569.1 branched-chain amino acid ABC transporter permease [Pararhodobacter zhoushanensis]